MTTLLIYLALLVYLAPDSNIGGHWDFWYKQYVWRSNFVTLSVSMMFCKEPPMIINFYRKVNF